MSDLNSIARPVVLFDLDGTLLPMDYDTFEKKYFGGLCAALEDIDSECLIAAVWRGVKAMVGNDGSLTNRQAFANAFSAASGAEFSAVEDRFLRYYETEFQRCREVCGITPISGQILDVLQEKGYTVAVATNPLFPQVATYSRLRWLGIDPHRLPLVTTFEDSCFAKPNPAYYLEVCRRLGVRPEECVMIGNDVQEDGAAAAVGMQVILITEHLIDRNVPSAIEHPNVRTLSDILAWASELPSIS